jgi:radical SAM superfamily enzyme YgiQ (UPF0313 family)
MPFLGVAYLAAVLEREGIPVKLLDAWGKNLSFAEIKEQIQGFLPDLIGITCTASAFGVSVELAKKIKSCFQDIPIVFGGPYVSAIPEETLREIPWIDMVIVGEGEYTLLELAQGRPAGEIKGIVYRDGPSIVSNDPRPVIDDLDALPFPARHFYDIKDYMRPFYEFHGTPFAPIITSRGCPFKCRFCASHVIGGRQVRLRSISNIIEEIDMLLDKYKVKFITIADDAPVFTMDQKRLNSFCQAIAGKKFFWGAKARADSINKDNLSMMRDAGCRVLEVGCESGNPDILREWEKGVSVEQIRQAFKLMNQYGISSVAMFMLGAPTETEQTIRNTARFARELGATYVIARILYPYPGTEAYCDLYEHKMFKIRDWNEIRNPRKEDVTISHPNLATNELSLPHITFKKIIALQSELHILFYCDPKYMLRTILKIRNWSMLKKYISLLSGIVRFWLRYGLR